jgi:general secretion pathway protein D
MSLTPTRPFPHPAVRRAGLAAVIALLTLAGVAAAQNSAQRITPSFKDADIGQIIEAVGTATGKNFIVDPRVRAQVTMLSSTPMTPDAFYQAFLSILQVHGFVAVPAGDVIKIIPDANARQSPGNDLPGHVSASSDEIVTQVIAVKNVSAAQLVPILRPLIPQYGHLAAYPASNILIISDRANNVNRIMRIISRIDEVGDSDVEVITLQNASAGEIVRIVTQLMQSQAAEGGGAPLKLVADDRSNSVLISGEANQRLKAKALVAHLDTPLENGGDTQVRYLHYADAEKIGPKLKEQLTGAATTPATGGAAAIADKSTTIWADPVTNALIITAPPKTMRALMSVIDKLDIRRPQVLVEAIIVEVTSDKAAELGVNWVIDGHGTNRPVGGFVSPVGGSSIVDLAAAVQGVASGTSAAAIPTGTTFGIGRLQPTGINFAAMIRALRGDTNNNIIATPSITTMDNQEAQIKVAQEVPFITGQFTNTGTAGGSVNPFQTIQRQEVGTILKITPQINEGDAVMLKISAESSSLTKAAVATVDVVTNKRTFDTRVLIEDGGTVVIGGLIQDTSTLGEQRVPFLGRIPLLGELFRTRSAGRTKNNLMVFIKPTILRDGVQAAIETNSKYNYMREEQRKQGPGFELIPILPGNKKEILPSLKEPPSMTPGEPVPAKAPTGTADPHPPASKPSSAIVPAPAPADSQASGATK